MEIIDNMIEVLKRVKRCSLAYEKIKNASENMLFSEEIIFDDVKQKWVNNVKNLLKEALILIEKNDDD